MTSIVELSSQKPNWYRGFIQGKTRITLAWVFACFLGLSAREYPAFPGVFLCFLGASLRFWASGYLRKDARPAVGGPYAFVRNPLYLGTYLMAVGVAWATENWIFLMVVTVSFSVIYHYIILDEELKLQQIFKGSYIQYCKSVPRFFPKIWPPFAPARVEILRQINPDLDQHFFTFSLAMKNKAYEAYAAFVGLIGFVAVAAYAWKHF